MIFLDKTGAASATWTGAGGNNYWTNNANWSTGAYPGNQSGAVTTDVATFANNSPAQTSVNLGAESITISNIAITSGAPAFTFSSSAPAYLLFPNSGGAGNITVSSGVINTEDFSGLALIRGSSGAGSTSYNIANNGSGLLKLPVLTQYSSSGNIRIVFSGASGAPISATGNDRSAQTTELLLNAPITLYLQDTSNDGNFNGGLYIRQGTVSVPSVALKSVGHSPLGGANFIYLGSDDNIGQNSTLQFTGAGSGTTDEPFSLTKGNTGIFDITNATGDLTLTAGINEINSTSTTLSGSLAKIDLGTLTLDARASYTGSTTVTGGTLSLGVANAITTSTNLILGGSGTAGTLDLGGFNQQFGALSVASGATANNQIITNSSAANAATLVFSNSAANPSIFGGVIVDGSKPVGVTVLNGSLTLTNASTYSGNTTIAAGALALGAGGLVSSSAAIIVNTNAIFDVSGNGNFNLAAGQTLSGYGVVTGNVTAAGCLITPGASGLAGTLTFTSGLTLNGGVTNYFDLTANPNGVGNDLMVVGNVLNLVGTNTIQVNLQGTSLGVGTYTLVKFGSLGAGGATNFQVAGFLGAGLQSVVSNSASAVDLIVSEASGIGRTWVGDGLTNAWDYTSVNWVNGSIPSVYSDGDFVTFDDTGSNTPPVNLTAVFQPAAVLVDAMQNYTFSGPGQISGAATLTKTNSGTLTILTTNNYYGITTISQGTLQLGNGTTSGSIGTNVIQNSGVLVLNLPGSNSFADVISGAGQLVQAGSATLTLAANNSYTGGTTISAGTLQIGTGAWFGSGNVTNNSALVFNSAGNSTVSAVISGSGSLTLANNGTVTLSGNNTYSGGTTVNAGTLLVNNSSGSGTGTGAVVVGSGGTLGGGGKVGGPVTINSGGIFSPGSPVGMLTVGNNFTASSGAVLNYTLGTSSDKTVVNGNLSLSGTLNITAGSGFTSGTYTLFTYGGTLALGGLTINLPANTTGAINTNTPGQVNLVVGTLQSNIPAFPGALGFGAGATGARFGGTVYHVTNTNDSGAGSFRQGVSQADTFVVFDVGGTITLASPVTCASDLTIAGQTAPGGIAIIGHEISMSVKTNEIVRYLRIRPGSIASSTEDGINMGDGTNMIFDHISIEFAPYNNIDATGNNTDGNMITMQNSILADPIGQQFNAHTESVGNRFSWFYNILSSGHDRNPLAKVNTIFINNVVNNFQAGYTCADTSGNFSHDIVNNYFISGSATTDANDDFFQFDGNQSVYASGNLLNSNNHGTLTGSLTAPGGDVVLNSPWSSITPTVLTYPTLTAYRVDVSLTGALPLDQVDQNVMGDVTSLGNAGAGGGLWRSQTATGLGNAGYGVITPGTLPVDSDGDGIPDYYEAATGSNPNVADSLTPGAGGYTKLENYLNWLAAPNAVTQTNEPVNVDLTQYTAGFTNDSPAYSVFASTNGTIALQADGHTAAFMPALNFFGLGSFSFSVLDADGSTMTNTVTVCVTPMPQPQYMALTWRGDGVSNNWDTTTASWFNGTNLTTFYTDDPVTFDDTGSDNPPINLTGPVSPSQMTVNSAQNYTLSGSGYLSGTMTLSNIGTGTLTLSNTTANNYTGGTVASGGNLVFGTGSAIPASGALMLNNTGAVTVVTPNSLPNVQVNGTNSITGNGNSGTGIASLTDAGTLTLFVSGGDDVFDLTGAMNGSGTLVLGSASMGLRFNGSGGDGSVVFNLGTGANVATIRNAPFAISMGGLAGSSTTVLQGASSAATAATFTIGGTGPGTEFDGVIQNGGYAGNPAVSVVKTGGNMLAFTGANTYSGGTTINGGTLIVNNSGGSGTGSGAVTVAGGGMLAGGGSISGAVTVQSGGALAPGNPLGTLTIGNSLTLAAGSTTFVQVQHSPQTNGAVTVFGTLGFGGTLNVTNIGGALAGGDSFQLFNAGTFSGAFTSLVLPPLATHLDWNTNALKTSGVISIVALTSPAITGFQISGGNFVVSGSGGTASWPFLLTASTNLGAGQWLPVATNQFDAAGNFILTNAINAASQQIFYRLQLQ